MTQQASAVLAEDAPAETHARSQTSAHNPALDGVRGIAILLVLMTHLGAIVRSQPVLSAVMGTGWLGVDLFFVLSGFLITRILIATRTDPRYYHRFYVRRGLRIWPLYYAFVVGMYLLLTLASRVGSIQHFAASRGQDLHLSLPLICYLLFIQNLLGFGDMLGMTWSLCIEEHFYLIWPVLLRRLSLETVKKILWVAFALSPVLRVGYYLFALSRHISYPDYHATIYHSTPFHLDSIIAGSLLGIYWVEHEGSKFLRPIFGWMAAIGLPLCVICLIFERTGFVGCLLYSAASVLFTGCVGLVLFGWQKWLLLNRQLRYMGKISFGFYLFHPVIVDILQSHPLLHKLFPLSSVFVMELCGAVLAVSLSLALAAASFAWFESPILRLKSRLAP
ncbi:acyltransferase family protein [Silvibacterium acidisoli]|uniref:acyltransferase family protein n=1 Tax=Acidobacteriaceae bacterium ZG23-2 TaxID=2883246 RepID=UPI00406C0FA0